MNSEGAINHKNLRKISTNMIPYCAFILYSDYTDLMTWVKRTFSCCR